jgi:hypothetical protein
VGVVETLQAQVVALVQVLVQVLVEALLVVALLVQVLTPVQLQYNNSKSQTHRMLEQALVSVVFIRVATLQTLVVMI